MSDDRFTYTYVVIVTTDKEFDDVTVRSTIHRGIIEGFKVPPDRFKHLLSVETNKYPRHESMSQSQAIALLKKNGFTITKQF